MVELGGGRRHAAHPVDHAVGLTEVRAIGDEVGPDRPLALVHARDEAGLAAATARLLAAYQIADEAVPPMILDGSARRSHCAVGYAAWVGNASSSRLSSRGATRARASSFRYFYGQSAPAT